MCRFAACFMFIASLSSTVGATDSPNFRGSAERAATDSSILQASYQMEGFSEFCSPEGQCGEGCCCESCLPFWAHRHRVFGDWLFLSARGQHVDYATPVDGATATATPVGRTEVLDPGYHSAYRVGGGIAIDRCSSIDLTFTKFQSNVDRSHSLPGGGGGGPSAFLMSELTHPNTQNVAADSLLAEGSYGVDFVTADGAFTKTVYGDCNQRLNATVGFRYGQLEQNLAVRQTILNDVLVETDIDFHGYGPRIAADYERMSSRGLLTYFRGGASLLMGRFDADFQQTSVFSGTQATAGIFEDRIVPQFELELGTGWQSPEGAFRITAGYLVSAWSNIVTTPAFIDGVQAQELDDISETITFGGLAVRAEVLF